jgi:adenylosuccinate lyase
MIGRYQSAAIEAIWNEGAGLRRWTEIEVAAAAAWHARGGIPDADMQAIETRAEPPSPARVRELEKVTDHDVVAFVRALAEKVGEPASRHLHRGLTSSDVVDTALALAMRDSLEVLEASATRLREAVAARAREFKRTPCIGRTHGIHAEPTTFGLRLAGWHSELGRTLERLSRAKADISYGKLSGAVGTFSQTDPAFEAFVIERLGLVAEPVATQVIPRDRHASVMTTLALLGGTLERFALEIRHLQRTEVGEAFEPFATGQTGSSAMPHKKNPITSERICGLSRLLRGYASATLEDMALWHERDISHSSVERIAFPDAFHLADYMLQRMTRLVRDLRVFPARMRENLECTRGLVFSQNVLAALLDKGLERQAAYALVQGAAMRVMEGQAKDFATALWAVEAIRERLSEAELLAAFDLAHYLRHVDALFARAGLGEEEDTCRQ